jgi:2-hydroxy-4-carboxymuconate semialdehyde hemiacetal dehydrogenase
MKVIVAGPGAFGQKHLDAIRNIDGVETVCLVGRRLEETRVVANTYSIPMATTELSDALKIKNADAVILATPTQIHAKQAIDCMNAGKHVQIEIPLADNIEDAGRVLDVQKETGLIAMVGHTRRFNPSHQWLNQRLRAGNLSIQQMNVQTYFFRRQNMNAKGEARSWTDHLLWHHAAHTVDLFQYQTGERVVNANILQGPKHPGLGIAMDMSIQLESEGGKICTLSLSFNNDGPLGTYFRYICDNGTYIARYDDLVTGREEPIDVSNVDISMNGVEIQDREFFNAIKENREPNTSVSNVFACYETLHMLEQKLSHKA